jgi:membrane-bound metal-dependent hydrolase YbcI (DUF457 family)
MFLGHFAVGLASKRFARRTPLVVLFTAALLPDILGQIFGPLGWEHASIQPGNTRFTPLNLYDYPWSHSLLMTIVWGTALALIWNFRTRDLMASCVICLATVSHWFLDWLTHGPDLPLYPGAHGRHGLGLWNSIHGTLAIEIAMFCIGIWLYVSVTKPRDWIGKYMFGCFLVLLLLIYVEIPFTPPPSNIRQMGFVSIALLAILLAWAAWVDNHRVCEELSAG